MLIIYKNLSFYKDIMGNVKVTYKRTQGSTHSPGTQVTDPHEWFEHLSLYQFEEVQTLFNAATDSDKAIILEILGDSTAMESQRDFASCISDFSVERRAEKMDQLK